jgi:biotin transport system substrate-specific component
MILISLFAALTAIGAFIRIPTPFVPFTLQIFFVILAGLVLGSRAGFASQAVYIFIGLTGVPVFSEGGGIHYVLNYKFGYLLGFAAAAFIIGLINEKFLPGKQPLIKLIAASCIGLIACYIIGVSYMYIILKYVNDLSTSVSELVRNGFLVFLPWDTLKIITASCLAKEMTKRLYFLNRAERPETTA